LQSLTNVTDGAKVLAFPCAFYLQPLTNINSSFSENVRCALGMRAAPNKHKLNNFFIRNLKPREQAFLVWDTHQRGLAVAVLPTGRKSYQVIYRHNGRPRWYHIGHVDALGLDDARKLASRVMFAVAEGKDPAAERRAERNKGSFEDLYQRYIEHAKRKNRSWALADSWCAGTCYRDGQSCKRPALHAPT
jgi:hypothetical protein